MLSITRYIYQRHNGNWSVIDNQSGVRKRDVFENETYQVTIEDLTGGEGRKLVEYLTDTKYIVPNSVRPNDNKAHIFHWSVQTMRQTGTDDEGKPVWESAGAPSLPRTFSWTGVASAATQTP